MPDHLMFVYGTLKRAHHNNRLLTTAEFLGDALTCDSYGMERTGSPRVYRNAPAEYAAPIAGELYKVDDLTLTWLDQLEGHPDWYCREQVCVKTRGRHGAVFQAWLYFMPIAHKTTANDLFKIVARNRVHTWGK